MDDCMYDPALLEADCAAEDRFVFTFARRLLRCVPVGLDTQSARALAQVVLDEAFERRAVPARLSDTRLRACLRAVGLAEIVLPSVRAALRPTCPGRKTRPLLPIDGALEAAA